MQNFTNCWTRVKEGSLRMVDGLKCVVTGLWSGVCLGLVNVAHGLLNLVWLGAEPVVAAKRTRQRKKPVRRHR